MAATYRVAKKPDTVVVQALENTPSWKTLAILRPDDCIQIDGQMKRVREATEEEIIASVTVYGAHAKAGQHQ